MNNLPSVPLHVAGSAEEQQSQLIPVPDARENFAADREAAQWCDDNVTGLIDQVAGDGDPIRQEWAQIRQMSLLQHGAGQGYRGMSNAYLPVYAKARETRVSHSARGLFPTDEYVDVKALHTLAQENQADVLKAWMQYQLDCQARVRVNIKPFLRQLYDYGLSVGKVWYNTKLRNTGKTTKLPALPGSQMDYGYDLSEEGTRFETRSVFSWYVWPQTINHIREATLVFEVLQVPLQYLKTVGKAQGWINLDIASYASTDNTNTDSYLQQAQEDTVHTTTTAVNAAYKGELGTYVLLREAYFNMPIPARFYRDNEKNGDSVPVQAVFANGTLVSLRRNPYWFQHAPYVVKRINESPDSFTGMGMGRLGLDLQGLANDFMNQTNDNLTYGLNPVTIVNPMQTAGELLPLEPGRMWHMLDPQGVRFDRPPVDQVQYGMNMVNMLMGTMNDLLGTPPIMQGTGAGGSAKTATGAQLLQNNVKTDLQDTIEDIELEVLEPLMYMIHALGQQYQSDELSIATSGGIVRVRPDDLAGRFSFKWLASSQAANQQMRSQQALALLQAILPLVPLIQQQGAQVNPIPLLKKVYGEGMGFRDFDEFIQVGQMGGMPPGMAPPGMPGMPTPPGPQGPESARSTVDQAAGNMAGSTEMAQGEGEAFGEVRAGADDISAMMGAMGGGPYGG